MILFLYLEMNSGEILYSKNASEKRYPASLTKVMTCLLTIEMQPDLEAMVTVTKAGLKDMEPGGSNVALKVGEQMSVKDLLYCLMVKSGNDAASVLAVHNSGSIEAFVEVMNRKAQELGCTGTHFVNPDGIHDTAHYTTFADLTILGKLAMADETVMQYAKTPKELVTLHGETIEWKNTNALVDPATPYYCPYAVGLKTGQTPSAGSCLLSAFRMEEHELLIGVFGCPEEEDRFDDTLQLFNQIVLN